MSLTQAEKAATRVLVVDDDPDVREATRAVIETLGYDVSTAASAEEATAQSEEKGEADVLITDISLPGQSGLELAADYAERNPEGKVVYASGYGEVSEHMGVPGTSLPKPFDAQALEAVLTEVVESDPLRSP